jgi:cold shock CspA family protein
MCNYLSSCRVAVERDQLHQDSGNPFRIRIDMTVPPGHELVIRRESSQGNLHDSLPMMLRLAFAAAARSLRELVTRQHRGIKNHFDPDTIGTVVLLFQDAGYGFIRTRDDRDIYFHRNSVLHSRFDDLALGAVVRFVDELGEAGPQATTVEIMEKSRINEPEASTATAFPDRSPRRKR